MREGLVIAGERPTGVSCEERYKLNLGMRDKFWNCRTRVLTGCGDKGKEISEEKLSFASEVGAPRKAGGQEGQRGWCPGNGGWPGAVSG